MKRVDDRTRKRKAHAEPSNDKTAGEWTPAQSSFESHPVQRWDDVPETHLIRPEVGPEGGPVGPELELAIHDSLGSGQSLDPQVRERMEPRLGHDFSQVRIHADGESDVLARRLGATAFTTGSHIYFQEGSYRPEAPDGALTLAHELTHVMQQRGESQTGTLSVFPAGDALEQEAASSAAAVATSAAIREGSPPSVASGETIASVQSGARTYLQGNRAVQRQPQAGGTVMQPGARQGEDPLSVKPDVIDAYQNLLEAQKRGLHRLERELSGKPERGLLATLALAAVTAAIGTLLTPVGDLAAAYLIGEGLKDTMLFTLVAKTTEKVAEEALKEGAGKFELGTSPPKGEGTSAPKGDPIGIFIEIQEQEIDGRKRSAVAAFDKQFDAFKDLPDGGAGLRGIETGVNKQIAAAADVQVAHSAGQWVRGVAGAAHNPFTGSLELTIGVDNAPIRSAGDIKIHKSNWFNVSREIEDVVQEHGKAAIKDLEAPLWITIETPHGNSKQIIVGPSNRYYPLLGMNEAEGINTLLWIFGMPDMAPKHGPIDPSTVLVAKGLATRLWEILIEKPTAELKFG